MNHSPWRDMPPSEWDRQAAALREPRTVTAEGLLTARWFHVGRPWSEQPGLIYAGSEDPHAGTFVVDCRDWSDETHFGEVQTVDVAALADGIVRDHNAALTPSDPLDVATLSAAMNEAYTYADRDNSVPTLPFVDDGEAFWDPFATLVVADLSSKADPEEPHG